MSQMYIEDGYSFHKDFLPGQSVIFLENWPISNASTSEFQEQVERSHQVTMNLERQKS